MVRVPVAFLVAPLAAPVAMGLLLLPGLVELLFESPELLLESLIEALTHPLVIFAVGYSLSGAYLITLLVGVPLFRILRKLKLTEFCIAPAVGCLVPVTAVLIFVGTPPASELSYG